MEETSGATVPDVSGNGHDLTINGTPNWSSDAPITSFTDTKSLSFDGVTYAFNTDDNMCPQNAYTIEAWVKASSSDSTSDEGIVGKWTEGGYLLYSPNHHADTPFGAVMNSADLVSATTPTRDKGWHYISQTWDGSSVKIYVDGKEENSQQNSASPICFGGGGFMVSGYNYPNVKQFFTGQIDEVRLYDYARTSSQIIEDAGITSGSFPTMTPTSTPSPTPTPTLTDTPTPTPTPTLTPTPIINQLVINEVFPGGTSATEWVELFNPTSGPIDVSGWQVFDNTTNDTLPSTTPIGPGGYAVIVGSGSTVTVPVSAIKIQLSSAIGKGLASGGDRVLLKDSLSNTIDFVSWGSDNSAFPTPPSAPLSGESLARFPNGTDTDTAADWFSSSSPSIGIVN